MTVGSKLVDSMPEGYGYVVLVGAGSTFVNMWMAINVGRARKKYEVEYPNMYSDTSKEFNCIQRAHQNTLEGYPSFLMLLFVGGLQYPKWVAGFGVLYLLSRVAFALGYYTGEPKKRVWGAWGHLPLVAMMGSVISLASFQLGWVHSH